MKEIYIQVYAQTEQQILSLGPQIVNIYLLYYGPRNIRSSKNFNFDFQFFFSVVNRPISLRFTHMRQYRFLDLLIMFQPIPLFLLKFNFRNFLTSPVEASNK